MKTYLEWPVKGQGSEISYKRMNKKVEGHVLYIYIYKNLLKGRFCKISKNTISVASVIFLVWFFWSIVVHCCILYKKAVFKKTDQ